MAQPHVAPASALRDLKTVGLEEQVAIVRHVGNSFEITTVDGHNLLFTETNLRFKIDTSEYGPLAGKPVLLPGGMMGDRATIFFVSPGEIAATIERRS